MSDVNSCWAGTSMACVQCAAQWYFEALLTCLSLRPPLFLAAHFHAHIHDSKELEEGERGRKGGRLPPQMHHGQRESK